MKKWFKKKGENISYDNKDKKYLNKEIRNIIIIFVLSILIRSILAIITGEYITFRDELLHLNIAKALANGDGIAFRGYYVKRYDFLYSFCISIATLATNAEVEHILVMVINSILMSSVVFPTYFLSKKFMLNIKYVYAISIISLCIPEMIYTSSVLQENLMYPFAIWYLYLFFLLYENIDKNKNAIILSIFTFILCLVKDFGLAFFTGTVLFFFFELIANKKNRKFFLKTMLLYSCSFLIIWLMYRRMIERLTYEDTMVIQAGNIFIYLFDTILNPSKLLRLIYPFIIYCISTITFYGIFPILIPFSQYKDLSQKERELLRLSFFIILSYIGVTCILITSKENYNSLNLRIHYRYYFFMIIPIYIVFFSMIKKAKMSISLFILLFFYLLILSITKIALVFGARIDCPIANILDWFNSEMLKQTIVILIIFFVFFCTYLLYRRKNKLAFIFIFVVMFFTFLIDSFIGYKIWYRTKNANQKQRDYILQINKYIERSTNDAEDLLLIIGDDEQKIFYLEAYLQQPYKVVTRNEFIAYMNDMKQREIHMEGFSQKFKSKTKVAPTYIITQEYMKIKGYSIVFLDTDYLLYQLGDGESIYCEEPVIYGRYHDNWINKDCVLVFSGDKTEEKTKIKLEMDTIFEEEMQVNITDSTGYTQEIIVTPLRNFYEIYVNKMSGEINYEITISTEKSYNPNNGDPRQLSYRIYNVIKVRE